MKKKQTSFYLSEEFADLLKRASLTYNNYASELVEKFMMESLRKLEKKDGEFMKAREL
ncbi:MAG: hypothetical protein V2A56_10660 [bacterium]